MIGRDAREGTLHQERQLDQSVHGVLRPAGPLVVRRVRGVAGPLAWIQIGSMAGADITLPSHLLRAANLQIMGSGKGSLTRPGILAELPSLAAEIASGTFAVNPLALPLAQVEQAWSIPTTLGQRIVLAPAN
ncbi:hypothetical protein G3I60_04155 [Streptomyces sp. SID13666]|nr:hypothetical protein [Streptomyces sp. SID13666]